VPACSQEEVEQAAAVYGAAYRQHQATEAALQDARSRYSGLRDRLRDTRVRVWALKREAASAALEAQRDHALGELGKYLRYNRDRFTKSAWDALLAYASDFVRQASDGAISALQRDEQGDFTFIEGGEPMPLELASGMQLAILGVGVKLALGAAVGSNFDVLLLDEVSAAASDENALRLTECLAATGQQVLLISHRMADTVPAHDVIALAA
jgi:ATPase subunit of ABC transporter with duplicated ATPase domains